MISPASVPIIIFTSSLYVCMVWVSSEPLEEIKLIDIVNRIFHSPWDLRSFIISFKYGLIIPRYSLIDKVLSLSPLLSYSIQLLLKALKVFVGWS